MTTSAPKKSGTVPIHKNHNLTNLTSNQNISALPETLFNTNSQFNDLNNSQDLTNSTNLPKTYSYLKRASEPLSKFIQASSKYGYL